MGNIIHYLEKVSKLRIRFNVPKDKETGLSLVRDPQIEAIETAITKDRLNIQMPTGSGKSLVLRGISYKKIDEGMVGFIIVPSYDIADTILSDIAFETHSLNPKIHAPQRNTLLDKSTKLIITTYASFWRRLDEYIGLYGADRIFVIYDEAHHVNVLAPRNFEGAKSFKEIYSITASSWSPFCLNLTKNRFIYRMDEAIKDGVIAKPNVIDFIPEECDNRPEIQPEIWYYDSIEEAYASFGKSFEQRASGIYINHKAGINLHQGIRAGLTCSIADISTPDLIKHFNRGLITRAVVIDKLKEGFDSSFRINGKKIPVKRVVIKTGEKSPISLYQRAGRALRPGGGIIHCYSPQKAILQYAFDLANGLPIVCNNCQQEHLTMHHAAVVSKGIG